MRGEELAWNIAQVEEDIYFSRMQYLRKLRYVLFFISLRCFYFFANLVETENIILILNPMFRDAK